MRYLLGDAEWACSKSTPMLRTKHISRLSIILSTPDTGWAVTFVLCMSHGSLKHYSKKCHHGLGIHRFTWRPREKRHRGLGRTTVHVMSTDPSLLRGDLRVESNTETFLVPYYQSCFERTLETENFQWVLFRKVIGRSNDQGQWGHAWVQNCTALRMGPPWPFSWTYGDSSSGLRALSWECTWGFIPLIRSITNRDKPFHVKGLL